MSTQPAKIHTTISISEFITKISQILWRLPSMIVSTVKGLRSIGSNKNNSWGLELEKIAKKISTKRGGQVTGWIAHLSRTERAREPFCPLPHRQGRGQGRCGGPLF